MSKLNPNKGVSPGLFARSLPLRCFKVGLSAVVAASVSGVLPAFAYADGADVLESFGKAAQEAASAGYQSYTATAADDVVSDNTTSAIDPSILPSKYDLRDPNGDGNTGDSVVTPVKFQNPWGTCWGFSTIAACETSVLSKAGKTFDEVNLDLSELQLVHSVYNAGGVPEKYVGEAQAGEGYNNESDNVNLGFDSGGFLNYGSNIFASGIGPALESSATYRNTGVYNNGASHDDDPVYMVMVTRTVDPSADDEDQSASATVKSDTDTDSSDGDAPKTETNIEYLTGSQIKALDEDESVAMYKVKCYAGNYTDADGNTVYTDWTIESQQKDKTDDSWWSSSLFNLEDGNELPDPRNVDEDGKFVSVNWDVVNMIKDELYKDDSDPSDFSRAVSVCFAADNSMPGDEDNPAKYISTEWAHYTNEDVGINHAVTIVGWDDDYDASNFAKGFENSAEGAAAHTPEGNGAWLVKNSWGSESGDSFDSVNFPSSWGIVDENGKHTGYFWISYYDKSLSMPETYNFDLYSYSDNTEYIADQYDYLVSDATVVNDGIDTPVYAANIFKASDDMDVRTLSCATYKTDTTVTFQVYLLDDKATTPTDAKHSKLAYTTQATFRYGGYHRVTLDKSDWVPMRKGQRYAVVTTQQASDGKYYQGAAVNTTAKLTKKELEEYRKEVAEMYDNYYRSLFKEYLTMYYESDAGKEELNGRTVEEAVNDALDDVMESEKVVTMLEKTVDAAVDNRSKVYFKARVNVGESLVGSSEQLGEEGGASGETEWFDWTAVVREVKQNYGNVAVDNASIKAFAEIKDYASVKQLSRLQAAVTNGRAVLGSVVVADSGAKVSASKQWMTKADYTKLQKAVAKAQKQLDRAGDYKTTLSISTPTPAKVKSVTSAVTSKVKAGVKQGRIVVKGGCTYTVSGSALKLAKAAKSKAKVAIPAAIKVNGKKLKVTGVKAGAFNGTKVKTVTVRSAAMAKKVTASIKGSKANITVKRA